MYKCLSFSVLTDTHDKCEKDTEFDFSSIPMIIDEAPPRKFNEIDLCATNESQTLPEPLQVYQSSGNLSDNFVSHDQSATVYDNKNQFDCGICQLPFSSKQICTHISTVHFTTQFSGKEKNLASDGEQHLMNAPQCTPNPKERPAEKQPASKEFVNEAKKFLKKGKKNNGYEYINDNPDGTFRCTICNSAFTVFGNANRHFQTVHEKLKPFECTVCKRCFAAKQVLMRHYTKIHGLEQPKGIKSTNEEKVYVYESNNSVKRSLKKAMKRLKFEKFSDPTVHEEENPVLCDLCNIILSNAEQFGIHFETMHKGKNQDIRMVYQ